jgi:hypothetical protein
MGASGSAAISAVRGVFGNDGFWPIPDVREPRIMEAIWLRGTATLSDLWSFMSGSEACRPVTPSVRSSTNEYTFCVDMAMTRGAKAILWLGGFFTHVAGAR